MVRRARQDWPQPDYYAVLDVPVTASRDEINRAYRRRARAMHPDVNGDDPGAEQHFDDLAAAREVLTDPTARAAYDKVRAARSVPDSRTTGHGDPGPSSRFRPSGPTIRPGPVIWRPGAAGRP